MMVLLECNPNEDFCSVILASRDKDVLRMIKGLNFIEEEARRNFSLATNKARETRGFFEGSSLLQNAIEGLVGGEALIHILGDFIPSHPIKVSKDLAPNPEKRVHLLQVDHDHFLSKIMNNLSIEDERRFFNNEKELYWFGDEEEEGGQPIELAGPQTRPRITAAYHEDSRGRKYYQSFRNTGDEASGLSLGPGGSPPTRPPTPPTKGTPAPALMIELNSDGETNSRKSFDETRTSADFPRFARSLTCYSPFITKKLTVAPDGKTFFRGVRWETYVGSGRTASGYVNSCTLDSFLTHVIIRGRQAGNNFGSLPERFFRIAGDNPGSLMERGLAEIITRFGSGPLDHPAQDSRSVDWAVKRLFVQHSGLRIRYAGEALVDFTSSPGGEKVGNEVSTVFDQTRPLWFLAHHYACACESQYEYHGTGDDFTPHTLMEMTAGRGQPSKLGRRKCKTCDSPFVYAGSLVGPTTWFLPFAVTNELEDPAAWPRSISFANSDPDVTPTRATFDLGYISYSTRPDDERIMAHHTSLQMFGNRWYYYDDLKKAEPQARLLPVSNPLEFVRSRTEPIFATAVVYFRRDSANISARCVQNDARNKNTDEQNNVLRNARHIFGK